VSGAQGAMEGLARLVEQLDLGRLVAAAGES
jgi:hypothetical protein